MQLWEKSQAWTLSQKTCVSWHFHNGGFVIHLMSESVFELQCMMCNMELHLRWFERLLHMNLHCVRVIKNNLQKKERWKTTNKQKTKWVNKRDMKQRKKWRMEVRTQKKGRRKDKQTSKRKTDINKQSKFDSCELQDGSQFVKLWFGPNNQSKCENRLGVSGTQGYRAWEVLHPPPPPLLPSGSPSASLWGRWEDSGAWHESTGPHVWDIQCWKCFFFRSLTQTLWKRLPLMARTRQTATSISLDAHPLHLKLWILVQKLIQGNFLSCLPGGAPRKQIRRWGRLNHDVQDEARIYDW